MREVLKQVPASLGFAVLLIILGGCQPNYTHPVGPPVQLTPEQQNFDAYWQAGLEVLRKYKFETDPARGAVRDRRGGKIVSLPMVGKNWLEFWRHDAATWYDYYEGNIQTIYRTARVSITPTDQTGRTFTAKVVVNTARSDVVSPNAQDITDAYKMFVVPGSSITDRNLFKNMVPEDEIQRQAMRKSIVDLGPDEAFGTRLSNEINDLANHKIMMSQ